MPPPGGAARGRRWARAAVALLLAGAAMAGPAAAQSRAEPEAATAPAGLAPVPAATAARHMIVAANPHAAQAGLTMLRVGGSAADAAIAALLVLNVVEPQSSGLGGGGFALVHGPEGLRTWDGRETAPAAAGPGLFERNGAPMRWTEASLTGLAVGVPGQPRLMAELHARHGRLAWADLFGPAIALAEEGFEVSPRLAALAARYAGRLEGTDAAAVFLPGGMPVEAGTMLRQPALAATLRKVASEGIGALAAGPLAEAVVAAVTAGPVPGAMTAADIAAYRAVERPAVCLPYRGTWLVCGMGPPSSGGIAVGQILGLMDRFKPDEFGAADARTWHLFAEASRLAYADRAAYLADPDAVTVPVRGLLDPAYLAQRAGLIHGFEAAAGKAEAGTPPWREGRLGADPGLGRPGTTHLSVVDGDGLAIALTASIETAFGTGRMASGYLLNNQLTDFSFAAATPEGTPIANAPGPGKRPRSSMAPTIVYRIGESRPYLLLGSPGGSRIPEYVAGALVAMLDLGMEPNEAAALFHVSQRNTGKVSLEAGAAPAGLADALAARGHAVEEAEMASGLHILRIGPEGLTSGVDPRREGAAAGD